jgi:hypothetical protein
MVVFSEGATTVDVDVDEGEAEVDASNESRGQFHLRRAADDDDDDDANAESNLGGGGSRGISPRRPRENALRGREWIRRRRGRRRSSHGNMASKRGGPG